MVVTEVVVVADVEVVTEVVVVAVVEVADVLVVVVIVARIKHPEIYTFE